uniref:Sirtuin 5 n=1 Tax=Scophthalmus maximus TaxID=52904 RepID=A0A8D3CE24_SCOMX
MQMCGVSAPPAGHTLSLWMSRVLFICLALVLICSRPSQRNKSTNEKSGKLEAALPGSLRSRRSTLLRSEQLVKLDDRATVDLSGRDNLPPAACPPEETPGQHRHGQTQFRPGSIQGDFLQSQESRRPHRSRGERRERGPDLQRSRRLLEEVASTGSLFKTRCMSCGHEAANHKSPICAALAGKGAPDPDTHDAQIPAQQLPRCEQTGCHGLLRPAVVWFGETLDSDILTRAEEVLDSCDLCLVVGTSSVVYPAAMFAPQVAARGVPVAEFNMEDTPATMRFKFHFHGLCGTTLPPALARHDTESN